MREIRVWQCECFDSVHHCQRSSWIRYIDIYSRVTDITADLERGILGERGDRGTAILLKLGVSPSFETSQARGHVLTKTWLRGTGESAVNRTDSSDASSSTSVDGLDRIEKAILDGAVECREMQVLSSESIHRRIDRSYSTLESSESQGMMQDQPVYPAAVSLYKALNQLLHNERVAMDSPLLLPRLRQRLRSLRHESLQSLDPTRRERVKVQSHCLRTTEISH